MEYRILERSEISKLHDLDRREKIEHIYYLRDGVLVLEKEYWDVPDWDTAEKQHRIGHLEEIYAKGASFFGTFEGSLLVGMALLDHNPLPTVIDRLNLAGIWVSRAYRDQGVGITLVQLIKDEACRRGAKTQYVSATPSKNTVQFYQSLGFRITQLVDPYLFDEEPEDIHMEIFL